MATGTVKNVVIERGFGFIKPTDGSADVFFHFRDLDGLPFDAQLTERLVEFDTVVNSTNGKTRAIGVRAANS